MILPVPADDLISSSEISLPRWCGAKDKADISTKQDGEIEVHIPAARKAAIAHRLFIVVVFIVIK
ncbi:hypothetical protein [uncultured Chryseobacterium sp.]|uniref:hypothetical protein n=1 Tax=uncultured Chryseobacterium sp. TaxID=259322 RepID=UPI0025F0E10F|nr:hypothetical protein [uncultured Chryseobacterium sp.]